MQFNYWVGKILWRSAWESPWTDWRAIAHVAQGHKESDKTEQQALHILTITWT